MHCFSMRERCRSAWARAMDLLRGKRHVPKRRRARRGSAAVPDEQLLVETDAPYLTPAGRAEAATSPPSWRTRRLPRGAARRVARGAGALLEPTERACSAGESPLTSAWPAQPPTRPTELASPAAVRCAPQPRARSELPRRLEHSRRDRKRRRARARADMVLEIGGGLGVLSEYLAERVAHVHVIEIDARLRERCGRHREVRERQRHWGDAMRADLAAFAPAPSKVVANLPYGVATAVLLRTIEELPASAVGRDGPTRGRRAPGGRTGRTHYGASSVIAQLACEVRIVRAIPRTVFHPAPNVDSVLVALRRRDVTASRPAAPRSTRRRERSMTPSLTAARRSPDRSRSAKEAGEMRHRLAIACARRSRHSATRRTSVRSASRRRTSPRSRECSRDDGAPPACPRAREDQSRPVRLGRSRHDGRHELVSVMQSISLADELVLDWASDSATRADEVICPGVGPGGENLAARALASFRRATGWDAPALRLTIAKRIPVAAGLGGGSADAAAVLRLAARASGIEDGAAARARDALGCRRARAAAPRALARLGHRRASRGAAGALTRFRGARAADWPRTSPPPPSMRRRIASRRA